MANIDFFLINYHLITSMKCSASTKVGLVCLHKVKYEKYKLHFIDCFDFFSVNTPQAPSLYSDVTEETEVDFGFQSGISTVMAAFGADIQHHLRVKYTRQLQSNLY